MLKVITRLKTSSVMRNIAVLVTGNVIAQILMILTSPVITRLYTPVDFGLFTIFISIVSVLIPGVSGKYEVAMVLPKDDIQGYQLFGVSVFFAIFVSHEK